MPSCDQTGMPHFHSSTTSGSASCMSLRILLRVSPRQSPSSAILFEMSSDADWPSLVPDFFMLSSSQLRPCVSVPPFPARTLALPEPRTTHHLGRNSAKHRREGMSGKNGLAYPELFENFDVVMRP